MATTKRKKPSKKRRQKPVPVAGAGGNWGKILVVPRKSRVRVRCEHCTRKTVKLNMVRLGNHDLVCKPCAELYESKLDRPVKSSLPWYAVSVVPMKEAEARSSILKRAKAAGANVKRVIVPKTRTAVVTKKTWLAHGRPNGEPDAVVLGRLTAETYDDAWYKAKQQWGDDNADLTIVEYKHGGKYRVRLEKNYPGYILVQMEWTPATSPVVEKAKCVTGMIPPRPKFYTKRPYKKGMIASPRLPKRFVNSKSAKPHDEWLDTIYWKPIPLEPAEVERILKNEKTRAHETTKTHRLAPLALPYAVGDVVRVITGPYSGIGGEVVRIHGMPKKARQKAYKRIPGPVTAEIVVRLLGRETTITVAHWHCVKG